MTRHEKGAAYGAGLIAMLGTGIVAGRYTAPTRIQERVVTREVQAAATTQAQTERVATATAGSEVTRTVYVTRYRNDGTVASTVAKAEKGESHEAHTEAAKTVVETKVIYIDRVQTKERIVDRDVKPEWAVNARVGLGLDGRGHWGAGVERVLIWGIAAGVAVDVPTLAVFATASWRF